MADKELRKMLQQLDDHERRIRLLEGGPRSKGQDRETGQSDVDSSPDLVLSIVNKISDCDEGEEIQRKILDKKSMDAKIILCLFISHKYFDNAWLTTGDIEKITSELGIKIDKRNAANKMKEIRQYLESASTRRKGQPTPYRLNRKGANRFSEILQGKQS